MHVAILGPEMALWGVALLGSGRVVGKQEVMTPPMLGSVLLVMRKRMLQSRAVQPLQRKSQNNSRTRSIRRKGACPTVPEI